MPDIFTRVSGGVIDVDPGDTTISNPLVNRIAITAFSVHNTTAGSITIDVYESPDTTSAAGKRIAQYAVGANASVDVVEVIGQGYTVGQNIIAQAPGSMRQTPGSVCQRHHRSRASQR